MTKNTDTMSGTLLFHDKTDVLCLGIDYFMTKHTDCMSGAFMCNGQITTRTHDSMINTHAHGHLNFMFSFENLKYTMQVCMSLYEIKNRQFVRE
jgi:hypothetical protein